MAQKFLKATPVAVDSIQKVTMRIKRNQQRFYIVVLLIFTVTAGLLFFKHYQTQQNDVAQNEMFQAVYFFEQEAFDKALHGDDTCVGLLDIVREYRFTQAAKLAHFYVGVSYMHQKNYKEAIQHLAKFRSKDSLVQARAWALIGDAYTEEKNYKLAVNFYIKAANHRPNAVFTPIYLTKAALACEVNGDFKKALDCYQRIIREFSNAEQYREALKHAARLKAINIHRQQLPSQQPAP